uniref:C2H2-type domain-containing protein n=1 Tax=Mycena chlorophos TaxID=658473 RepID=A0ABQ0LBY7_MYCCL|nr:predicted protein [Mycena chlorophos]
MKTPRQRSAPSSPVVKRNHVCAICNKAFLTGSHLSRHQRMHTDDRKKHECPFPDCDFRCSRKDNLLQHYRVHLSPGSRRRAGRVIMVEKAPRPRTPLPPPPTASPCPTSPPLTPPPLADSRYYYLRIGVLTKEEFDKVPVNLDMPQQVPTQPAAHPDPNRWRLLPPIDTTNAAAMAEMSSCSGTSSPMPFTSSLSAGASPYWSEPASFTYPTEYEYPPQFQESVEVPFQGQQALADVEVPVPSTQSDAIVSAEGTSVVQIREPSSPIKLYAPAPIRAFDRPLLISPEPELVALPTSAPSTYPPSSPDMYGHEALHDAVATPPSVLSGSDSPVVEYHQPYYPTNDVNPYYHPFPVQGYEGVVSESAPAFDVAPPNVNVFDERSYYASRRVSNPSVPSHPPHPAASMSSYTSPNVNALRRRSYPATATVAANRHAQAFYGAYPEQQSFYLSIPGTNESPNATTFYSSQSHAQFAHQPQPHAGWVVL